MGSSKAPPAPDYVGAAQAQGAANVDAARATGKMNNPNVINPYGTQTVSWNGDIPTITQTLSPDQAAMLQKETAGKLVLGDAGIAAANQYKNITKNPLDFSGYPELKDSEQYRPEVIDAMMSRVREDLDNQKATTQANLIAAGIRPGTEAYQREMDQYDRQYNDAMNNAILAAGQESSRDLGTDMQVRQQMIAEALTQRQTPLNEINALLTGSQVSNPFAGGLGFQGGASVNAAPIAQAITNQGLAQQNIYNQNQATQNANLQAGAGLIGSLGSAYLSR